MLKLKEVYRELLKDINLLDRVKIENFILVDLGLRSISQTTVPAEFPGGKDMGSAIDSKVKPLLIQLKQIQDPKKKIKAINMVKKVMTSAFEKIVVKSNEYIAHEKWVDSFHLKIKRVKIRPTVQEMYLYKERSAGKKIDKLIRERERLREKMEKRPDPMKGRLQFVYPEEFNGKWLRKMGALLGYPECCVEEYARNRENSVNVEARAVGQLKEFKRLEQLDSHAYFIAYFFPCNPKCKNALEKGHTIHEKLDEIDPYLGTIYLKELEANMRRIKEQTETIANYLSKTRK